MLLRLKSRKSGFSLIELLVVIAIIAILAAILFPVFTAAKKSAWRTTCCNNLKQLGVAFNLYRADYGGYFPAGGYTLPDADFSSDWQNVVWKYLKNDAVFRCPSTASLDVNSGNPLDLGADSNQTPRTPVTYLYNAFLGAEFTNILQNTADPQGHMESEVVVPTHCILLIDGNMGNPHSLFHGTDCHRQAATLWLQSFSFCQPTDAYLITGGDTPQKQSGLPAHGDGGAVIFVDGHVQYKQWSTSATLQASLPWMVCVPLASTHYPGVTADTSPWSN